MADARSDSLPRTSRAVKPSVVGGDDEAADRRRRAHRTAGPVPAVLVGQLGPDDGDIGDGAVGDPHLGSGQHVAVAVPLGGGAHRGRIGAGVGFGQPEAARRSRRRPFRAASGPSARPSRTPRSGTSPTSPGPRPGIGSRSRRPRVPGRPSRRRRSTRRRSRSRPGACRAGPSARTVRPDRGPAVRRSRTSCATCGRTISSISCAGGRTGSTTPRRTATGRRRADPSYGRSSCLQG